MHSNSVIKTAPVSKLVKDVNMTSCHFSLLTSPNAELGEVCGEAVRGVTGALELKKEGTGVGRLVIFSGDGVGNVELAILPVAQSPPSKESF